jgi:hypothetical protein
MLVVVRRAAVKIAIRGREPGLVPRHATLAPVTGSTLNIMSMIGVILFRQGCAEERDILTGRGAVAAPHVRRRHERRNRP